MARRSKKGRNINGVLLLDKPRGISSNRALQIVKRLYNAAKAGHTGALDPLASGMLPLCLGEATKFSQFLLDSDKSYTVTALLGQRTDTCDADGVITETKAVEVTSHQLEAALENFRGEILQVPSMYSALKHQGQPLYKLARKGIEIERPARPVTVHQLNLLQFNNDQVELEIHCSKGTYIRNIVDDLGQQLNCGAHVIALRRNFVADYPEAAMITLDQLQEDAEQALDIDHHLLALESPVEYLSAVHLDAHSAQFFCHGQAVSYPNLVEGDYFRVYSSENDFLGLALVDDQDMLAPKRLVVREH